MKETHFADKDVKLYLRQYIVSPASQLLKRGHVIEGDLIANISEWCTGARYHAVVSGVVRRINRDAVVIDAA